jgi:hypothetical protein
MALTTNVLGGGVAFNEWHPVSFSTDYNGNPEGDSTPGSGVSDGYMEFINTSATATINISGYQFWVFNGATMVVAHTVPGGTSLAPGETYTIVSGQTAGGGGTATGIAGQVAVADLAFTQSDSVNFFLVDTSGNFIVLTESGGESFLAADISDAGLAPANQVGQDIIDRPVNDQSVGRFPDGEDLWQQGQGPTPGDPNCFLAGTRIDTPSGPVAVENLRVGDLILTADGASVGVLWVGRQTISTRFAPAARLMPVCIDAGALGHRLPRRHLRVTADHALLIDGVLVTAGALVNGSTIRHLALSDFGGSYTVYHIETEAHEIILAEGMRAETYIDYVGRQAFENHAEYLALYGADRPIAEMPQPRITTARHLPPALRARLGMERAA